MQREQPVKDGKHRYCDFIMESAKELSEDSAWDPDTADLQTDEERYTETRTEVRKGQELTIRRKGVRAKVTVGGPRDPGPLQNPGQREGDNLNAMTDADLETEAAKAGVENYPKQASKAKRIDAIRKARQAVTA